MLDLWKRYPQVSEQLNDVNSLIQKLMISDNPAIQSLLNDCARQQGKMLRPGFFLLFSQLTATPAEKSDRLIKIAASLEILHQATLIHDDIIDDSPLRRGAITLQAKYGKDTAVYAGDLLFTVFFQLLIETMNGTHYLKINADAMQQLLRGELSQMAARFQQQQPVTAYLENIRGKTAALFRLACLEGAYFGGSDSTTIELAGEIGENIGMAFQIFDDILDYSSSTGVLRKPVLEDVAQGVYTLPLLLAYQTAPTEFKDLLDKRQHITKSEICQVAHLVRKHQGVNQAKKLAQSFTEKAAEKISLLPDSPVTSEISQLAQKLLKRKF